MYVKVTKGFNTLFRQADIALCRSTGWPEESRGAGEGGGHKVELGVGVG